MRTLILSRSLPRLATATWLRGLALTAAAAAVAAEAPNSTLNLRLSWGHESTAARPFRISFETNRAAVTRIESEGFEPGDLLQAGVAVTRAGGGDVDALTVAVRLANFRRGLSGLDGRSVRVLEPTF